MAANCTTTALWSDCLCFLAVVFLRFRGLICDLDGTLTLPQAIDFPAMRAKLNIPHPADVLTAVRSYSCPAKRAAAIKIIEHYKRQQRRDLVCNSSLASISCCITVLFIICLLHCVHETAGDQLITFLSVLRARKPASFPDSAFCFSTILHRDCGFIPKPNPSGGPYTSYPPALGLSCRSRLVCGWLQGTARFVSSANIVSLFHELGEG